MNTCVVKKIEADGTSAMRSNVLALASQGYHRQVRAVREASHVSLTSPHPATMGTHVSAADHGIVLGEYASASWP